MSWFEKGITLYVVLTIAACIMYPSVIFTDAHGRNPLEWVGISTNDFNETTHEYALNKTNPPTGFVDPTLAAQTSIENSSNGGFFNNAFKEFVSIYQFVVDGLGNIMGFLTVVFKLVFAPVVIMVHLVGIGAPSILVLAIGIPLSLFMFVSIAMFIRGII